MSIKHIALPQKLTIFAFFMSSLLATTASFAAGLAPEDILSLTASATVTKATFPDDTGSDTITATATDLSHRRLSSVAI